MMRAASVASASVVAGLLLLATGCKGDAAGGDSTTGGTSRTTVAPQPLDLDIHGGSACAGSKHKTVTIDIYGFLLNDLYSVQVSYSAAGDRDTAKTVTPGANGTALFATQGIADMVGRATWTFPCGAAGRRSYKPGSYFFLIKQPDTGTEASGTFKVIK